MSAYVPWQVEEVPFGISLPGGNPQVCLVVLIRSSCVTNSFHLKLWSKDVLSTKLIFNATKKKLHTKNTECMSVDAIANKWSI